MSEAPIALFVYNRPWHTRQTIEALQKNELAEESDLFIFSDAPKNPGASLAVQEVREYIRGIIGFKSVTIIEREQNLGLANSIIDGVTRLCNDSGRVIVLEDDLVTSPYFLRFMNDSLNRYERDDRVISIHGYMYPIMGNLPDTFFLRGADCWGWATWKRGWDVFEPDGKKLLDSLKEKKLEREFNFDGAYDYLGMLRSQTEGKNDSWAIRWHASAFLKNMLTLYLGNSLVQNIGNDRSGTHCGDTDIFSGEIATRPVTVGGVPIVENPEARSEISHYLLKISKTSRMSRAILWTIILWKRWLRLGDRS